jgi:hypothetical protein
MGGVDKTSKRALDSVSDLVVAQSAAYVYVPALLATNSPLLRYRCNSRCGKSTQALTMNCQSVGNCTASAARLPHPEARTCKASMAATHGTTLTWRFCVVLQAMINIFGRLGLQKGRCSLRLAMGVQLIPTCAK